MAETASADIPQFTPVNLITGFLGSGKTTLLKRMLASPALADTAVLINEFGEVGLDHELLEQIDDNTVLLQSGCLCCTIRGDLADAIRHLDSRRARGDIPAYKRLVIESTGLADPLPILTTVTAEPVLRHHYRLGLVVTTVDAVNGMLHLDRQPESRKQVAVADRLVLTKTDLGADAATRDLIGRLRRINPTAPLVLGAEPDLDVGGLMGHDLFDLASKTREVAQWFEHELEDWRQDHGHSHHDDHDHGHHDHHAGRSPAGHHAHGERQAHAERHDPNRHGDDIRAFAMVFDEQIDWTSFGLWLSLLLHRHGESILRVKGLLSIEGEPAPVAVHGVQQLVHAPTHLERWPTPDRRTRLVFIGRNVDEAMVRRSFAAFVLGRKAGAAETAKL
jgi:G3E family GTPase